MGFSYLRTFPDFQIDLIVVNKIAKIQAKIPLIKQVRPKQNPQFRVRRGPCQTTPAPQLNPNGAFTNPLITWANSKRTPKKNKTKQNHYNHWRRGKGDWRSVACLRTAPLPFSSISSFPLPSHLPLPHMPDPPLATTVPVGPAQDETKRVRMKRETLQAVLEQCQRTLELLNEAELDPDPVHQEEEGKGYVKEREVDDVAVSPSSPSSVDGDSGNDQLCDLLKSRIESPNFLEKLGSIQASAFENSYEENNSWNIVTSKDIWGNEHMDGESDSDQNDYILVSQEDIADGIACFMASYLLSLKETKDLSPNKLQEALSKTFSVKKKKGKLRKAWDGSKVIYNVASWGATAVGIYQNPALLKAASAAFWTSCNVISKLF